MTFVPDSVRTAFESQWSDARVIDPALLVRRALETPVSWRGVWQIRAGGLSPSLDWAAQRCTGDESAASRARENLLMMAVDARARGSAQRRARYYPGSMRKEWA